jgi:hypothetical protein
MIIKNRQREPPNKDLRAPTERARIPFDYTDEQWAEIEKSLRYLQPNQADLEKACSRLQFAARQYRSHVMNILKDQAREKGFTRCWVRVAKLSKALIESLVLLDKYELHAPDPDHPDRRHDYYKEHKDVLFKLQVIARMRLTQPTIDDGFPKAGPRVWFQFGVLKIWTDLGGKLQISRHPTTAKIKGPLVRYFSAAAQPVQGGSLESLPDVVARQKTLMAAIEKYRSSSHCQ